MRGRQYHHSVRRRGRFRAAGAVARQAAGAAPVRRPRVAERLSQPLAARLRGAFGDARPFTLRYEPAAGQLVVYTAGRSRRERRARD